MAAIKQVEVDERIEMDDEGIYKLIQKSVKQREDAAKQYEDAGRKDLQTKELAEADIIPNEWYTVKLKIGDALDTILDSAVFLEAGSFDITNTIELPEDMIAANDTAVCGDEVLLEVFHSDIASYQWYFNGNPIVGADTSSYLAQSIDAGGLGDGTYTIDVDFGYGCYLMDNIQIEFVDAPDLPDNVPDYNICDDDYDGIAEFDLTSYDSIIGNGE
jgi:hypothetical protein